MIHLLLLPLLFCSTALAVATPWPLTSYNATGYFQMRDVIDSYVLASNTSLFISLLDCNNIVYEDKCKTIMNITPPNTPKNNFGNYAKYTSIAPGVGFIAATNNVGDIYTYYCPNLTTCIYDNTINTKGNSDPTAFIRGYGAPLYFAYYPNINKTTPAIIVISCEFSLAPRCRQTYIIKNFIADCLSLGDPTSCLFGPLGTRASLAFSSNILVITFPEANNNRGLGLIYNCDADTINPCVISSVLINPYLLPYGSTQPNQYFGSALAMTQRLSSVTLAVGVPRAATPYFNSYSPVMNNLFSGGVLIYECSTPAPLFSNCSFLQSLASDYFTADECNLLSQNFGAALSFSQSELYVSSPNYCNGAGSVWHITCPYETPCSQILSDYLVAALYPNDPGDKYGFEICASDTLVVANAIHQIGNKQPIVGYISIVN